METNVIYRKSKTWQIWLAPMYTGVNNLFMVLMMFSSYIAAGGYGLAVATAGMIATASRVFDGITDPVIALLSDRFNSKYGKIRIIMGIGYLIICASVFSMFFLFVGKGAVAYTLCYMGYIIGYTLFGTASSIAPVVLTNDPVQRPKFYRWSNIYTSMITTLFTGLYLGTVLMPKYGGLTMEAFQELAITCMIGGGILLAVSFAAITPADKPENFAVGTKERISLRDWLPDDCSSVEVTLPYDAMIHKERSPESDGSFRTGYYPNGTWEYSKKFNIPETYRGKKVWLQFDGGLSALADLY